MDINSIIKSIKKWLLVPEVKQYKNWTLPNKQQTVGLIFTTIGLILTIYGFTNFNQDPRESLSSKGIEWNYQNFLNAIVSNDIEAIELFSEAGMKLKSNHFQSLVNKHLTPDISSIFLEYEVTSATLCPVDYENLVFYTNLKSDISKLSFTKQICGNDLVTSKLNKLLNDEAKSLKDRRIMNDNRELRISSCVNELSKTTTREFYNEASKFVITSVSTYSIRQEVLAKLNIELLMNSVKLKKPNEFLAQKIQEVCVRNNPQMKSTNERIVMVKNTLKIIGVKI